MEHNNGQNPGPQQERRFHPDGLTQQLKQPLREPELFSFANALAYMQKGRRVTRRGAPYCIQIAKNVTTSWPGECGHMHSFYEAEIIIAVIGSKTDRVQLTEADLLSTDWMLVNE